MYQKKLQKKFINDVYLKELDKIYNFIEEHYAQDNPKIQESYRKFLKNKNNMYDNRVL